jgi:hypothetical protein
LQKKEGRKQAPQRQRKQKQQNKPQTTDRKRYIKRRKKLKVEIDKRRVTDLEEDGGREKK